MILPGLTDAVLLLAKFVLFALAGFWWGRLCSQHGIDEWPSLAGAIILAILISWFLE